MTEDDVKRPSMKSVFWGGVEEAGTTIVKGAVLLILGTVSVWIVQIVDFILGFGFTAGELVGDYDLSWLGPLLLTLAVVATVASSVYLALYWLFVGRKQKAATAGSLGAAAPHAEDVDKGDRDRD